MVKIKVKPHEQNDINKALRRFKRLCEKEGIIKEYRKHEFYESPSETRRRQRTISKRRQQKMSQQGQGD